MSPSISSKGETISLIGHSGCGKSTLLNLIAGITTPTEGGLLCDNREIAGPGPERAVVFQNHSLLPWLSCFDNVALAVDQVFRRTMSKSERREWIEHNWRAYRWVMRCTNVPGRSPAA